MPERGRTLQEALVALIPRLLGALDHLEAITRRMHPPLLPELAASLGPDDDALTAALGPVARRRLAGGHWCRFATRSCWRARACCARMPACARPAFRRTEGSPRIARRASNTARSRRCIRWPRHCRRSAVSSSSRRAGTMPRCWRGSRPRVRRSPIPACYHFANETDARGGFSVYVPEYLTRDMPAPVVFALHGGSGHGRVFLWSWLREARSRGVILVAPTAIGRHLVADGARTWTASICHAFWRMSGNIGPSIRERMLLSGMSDGGTFTLLSGLDANSPFTHLAPVAASFHPMFVTMTEPERIRGLPIYLVHGALDWMFPIQTGRAANQALTMAGANVVFREIADLSHTYPRDEVPSILEWLVA